MRSLKLSRELKIGITTVLTIVAFIWGFNYLKGKDFFNKHRTFFVVYNDVSGLMKANSVTISGLQIGQVDDIYFREDNSSEVIVELTISKDVNIPDNSVAKLKSSDILGTKGIDIQLGNSTKYLNSGDTIKSDIAMSLQEEVNQMVQPILRKAGSMMSSIDTAISAVGDVFNYKTRENLKKSIESLTQTIQNIEGVSGSFDTLMSSEQERLSKILANVESITSNLRENNENLTHIISNAKSITDTVARFNLSNTLSNLESSIKNLTSTTDKINKGQGSLGLLLNDEKLYNDLAASSRQLDLLLNDIRINPKRYVHFSIFGKTGKPADAVSLTDTIK